MKGDVAAHSSAGKPTGGVVLSMSQVCRELALLSNLVRRSSRAVRPLAPTSLMMLINARLTVISVVGCFYAILRCKT